MYLTLTQQRRLLSKFTRGREDECWPWTGGLAGRAKVPHFALNYRYYSGRRVVYEMVKAVELRSSTHLYMTCGNKTCVNPDHMIWQLHGGNLPKSKCKRGHDMTNEDNIYITTQGKRACRACIRITGQARRERYRLEGRGWGSSYRKRAA